MEVRNQSLKGQNLNGEGEWRSKSVSIPNGDTVTARVVVSSSGNLDANDSLTFGYSLNGNGNSVAEQLSGDFGTDTITVAGLTGSSIELFVRMENDGNGPQNASVHTISSVFLSAQPDATFCLEGNCCWTQDYGPNSGPDCDQASTLATVCVGETVNFWYSGEDATQGELPSNNENPYIVGWIEGSTAGGNPNGTNITCNPGILLSPSCPTSCSSNDYFCMPSAGSITFGQAGTYFLNTNRAQNPCPNAICLTSPQDFFKSKIKVLPQPGSGQIQVSSTNICEGESVTIEYNGPSNVVLTDIIGNTGCNISGLGTSTVTLNGCNPGTYSFTVVASNQCGDLTKNVTLDVAPSPTADAGQDITVCEGDPDPTLGGNPTGSGGTPPLNYTWTGPNANNYLSGTSAPNPDFIVSNANPGTYTYTVEVEDDNGCVGQDQVTVTVEENPQLNVIGPFPPGQTPLCAGDLQPLSFWVFTDPGTNVSVSPGGSVTCISQWGLCFVTVSPTTTTTYTFTATGPNGCTTTQDVTIEVADCDCEEHDATAGPTDWRIGTNTPGPNSASALPNNNPTNVDITIDGNFDVDADLNLEGCDVKMVGHQNNPPAGTDPTRIELKRAQTLTVQAAPNGDETRIFS